jgi:hypothetical protein
MSERTRVPLRVPLVPAEQERSGTSAIRPRTLSGNRPAPRRGVRSGMSGALAVSAPPSTPDSAPAKRAHARCQTRERLVSDTLIPFLLLHLSTRKAGGRSLPAPRRTAPPRPSDHHWAWAGPRTATPLNALKSPKATDSHRPLGGGGRRTGEEGDAASSLGPLTGQRPPFKWTICPKFLNLGGVRSESWHTSRRYSGGVRACLAAAGAAGS